MSLLSVHKANSHEHALVELRLFSCQVLDKGKLDRSFHQNPFTHNPLETGSEKETVATAVGHALILKTVTLSMDKAELQQGDDFLAMLAREPGEEEVLNVGIRKKPVAKGDVVILSVQPITEVGQQIVTGGEPAAGELKDKIGRARPRL